MNTVLLNNNSYINIGANASNYYRIYFRILRPCSFIFRVRHYCYIGSGADNLSMVESIYSLVNSSTINTEDDYVPKESDFHLYKIDNGIEYLGNEWFIKIEDNNAYLCGRRDGKFEVDVLTFLTYDCLEVISSSDLSLININNYEGTLIKPTPLYSLTYDTDTNRFLYRNRDSSIHINPSIRKFEYNDLSNHVLTIKISNGRTNKLKIFHEQSHNDFCDIDLYIGLQDNYNSMTYKASALFNNPTYFEINQLKLYYDYEYANNEMNFYVHMTFLQGSRVYIIDNTSNEDRTSITYYTNKELSSNAKEIRMVGNVTYAEYRDGINSMIPGFCSFDLVLNRPIWWNGTSWVNAKGEDVNSIPATSGTFANKPTGVDVGYAYFCTDKQTTEGATNGIMIYHKGSNVWVDALGRVVS